MGKKAAIVVGIIFFITLSLVITRPFQHSAKPENEDQSLRLSMDFDNVKGVPKHFRKTDQIHLTEGPMPDLEGLASLKASGSAQFSENGLTALIEGIKTSMPIVVVDLREESHGFVNGIAVSWVGLGNKGNKGLTKEQVLATENSKLEGIPLYVPLFLYHHGKRKIVLPCKVENEETLVGSQGLQYIRIPVTDNERPRDKMVDYFIQFVRSLPPDTWVHFHCKEGIGRTTTFMTLYDMMRNAKKVSLEDIMTRQVLLGGKDLLGQENSSGNAAQRAEFVKMFYQYCTQNNDHFRTTWSEWLQDQEQ